MQIKEQQQRDSIRFVWNAMASNKTLQARATIPQALHYSPLDYNQNTILKHSPPTCIKCGSFMNPYNPIELGKQYYKCCICKTTNKVPENYFQDKQKMPPELTLAYSTFLIARNRVTASKDIGLVFLVDIALSEKELIAVKQSILELTKTLNDSKTVALITYNKYVQLHDLTSEMQNIITFNPNQQIDSNSFLNLLAIKKEKAHDLQSKFVPPLEKCRSTFTQKIQILQKVKGSSYRAQRESRAVGQALNVALLFCQASQLPLKIVFFCGGICTIGVGKIIEPEFKVQVRSIKQQFPKQSVTARQFYKKLGQKAKKNSTAIDSFIFSVQQVGLTEMLPCLKATNSLLVQHQEFSSKIFKQSFHRAYIGSQQCPSLSLATQSWIQFKCSSEIQFTGFQGKEKIQQQKEKVHTRFYIGNLNETTTVTALFQQTELNTQSQAFYIQICTVYRDTQNLNVEFLRVTTMRRPFVQTATDMITSFDQEAALYLIAKLSVSYPQNQKAENIRKWLDNLTIKWTTMFGLYRKGVWQSFQLPVNVRLFPQFIYYLRRNIVVRKSRVSLDEYSYICEIMRWETVRNVLLIIQPALLMYTPENTSAVPIGLDQKYMKNEVILILDSFFNIVQWRGKHIQGWYQENYHLSKEYGYMQDLYQNTNRDIQELKSQRFPAPTVYVAWPNHSKQRFIKSRLGNRQDQQQQNNISDQADIKSFMSKLIQIVVNN